MQVGKVACSSLSIEVDRQGARAHELSHVRHYDILIGTNAATFGSRDRKQNQKYMTENM
jgi:hypothetical protein